MKTAGKKLDFRKWSPTQRDLFFLLLSSALLKTTMVLLMPVINHDGPLYIAAAQKIAAGAIRDGIKSVHMPFYPLLIVFTHYIVPNWVVAAHLVSVVTSVFTIVPLYLLTRECFNREAALGACIAFILLPLSNHLSVEVMKDPTFLFFFAWTVYFAQRAIHSKKLIFFFLASLFSLFSILFRIEGVIVIITYTPFLLFLILRQPEQRAPLVRGMLVYLGVLLLVAAISFLILGAGWSSGMRLEVVSQMVKDFVNLKFLSNYMAIYKQLEVFETNLPVKGGVQNFAEIARHYLFLVYLVGFLESLVRALFPLYLIPLVWGLWRSEKGKSVFLLLLAGCYFFMLYYTHVKMDSIRERFFLSLVFFSCPWVGVGLERLFSYIKRSPRPTLLTIVCVLFLGILPIYKSVEIVWKQDNLFVRAGEWIGKTPEFKAAGLITNDRRISFYAGRGGGFYPYVGYDNLTMEKIALKERADLIAIKRSKKKKDFGRQFETFKEVKAFVGKKNIVEIYCSPKLKESIDLTGNH